MKKLFYLFAAAALVLVACDDKEDVNKGPGGDGTPAKVTEVEIAGTVWAVANVAEAGVFCDNPEDAGAYFNTTTCKTACPEGWRLPTDEEFVALKEAGSENVTVEEVWAGRTFGSGDDTILVPDTGFVLGSGAVNKGQGSYLWTGTQAPEQDFNYYFSFTNASIYTSGTAYAAMLSMNVRCVKVVVSL